ncbi:MAG: hypothetical protein IPH93_01620 [Saprospiraceae bacterium]|nr:hypothetical protein [Saprospiraceae bacterium]MBK7810202.1 hypothetical protein [Saprospiraceae bacterium]MBK9629806.1 hypothetical protein [Saprospiraceae bacterium]
MIKLNSRISFLTLITAGLLMASCSSSKKSADAVNAAPSEADMVKSMVSEIDANSSLIEKTVNLKGTEKGNVSFFADANGNTKKIVKKSMSSIGEKSSSYYFDGSDLIASVHLDKNTVKEKGKLLYTATEYLFKNGKAISSVSKQVKLKPADETMVDTKLAKVKFKTFVPNGNILRDELAIIKKLKQLS